MEKIKPKNETKMTPEEEWQDLKQRKETLLRQMNSVSSDYKHIADDTVLKDIDERMKKLQDEYGTWEKKEAK